MKKKKKSDKMYYIEKAIGVPPGVISKCTHVEMNGNREVIIEGFKSILQYEENLIRISTGKMIVSFSGRKLSIKCLSINSLIIEGFITDVKFIT